MLTADESLYAGPRPAMAIRAELAGNLPPGWVWRRGRSTDSVISALLAGPAEALGEVETTAARAETEIDPSTAVAWLADIERVLGPDPCARDQAAPSIDERQRIAHQRWTATGGASIAYFHWLAATLGVAIRIEEWRPLRASFRVGRRVVPADHIYLWRVRVAPTRLIPFRVGSRAGQRLGAYLPVGIECLFRRLKPAHTTLVFSYDLGGAIVDHDGARIVDGDGAILTWR
jgi:uncharacterized protein YmfQ (DUF2313 family)